MPCPLSRGSWKTEASDTDRILASSHLGLIPLGPAALFGLRLFSSLQTPSMLVTVDDRVGSMKSVSSVWDEKTETLKSFAFSCGDVSN